MIPLKSYAVVSSNAIYTLSSSAATCNTSLRCLSNRDVQFQQRRQIRRPRTYATIADHGHTCPTPYQIFAISKTAPYSKTRFYELVKLYHPDRNGTCQNDALRSVSSGISHDIKLERYRLIVAAHTILSDPVKRSAYDRWGAGWAGRTDIGTPWNPQHNAQGDAGPFTQWHDRANSDIWANATWEDWERWREKHDPHDGQASERQSPLFMSNSTFISVILVLAAVGSSWNYNRAENEGTRFLAARDAVHDQASKELRKVRQSTNQRPKDERIDWFVKNREASLLGVGVDEVREEKAKHVLPQQDNCLSEELRSRD
ncbi:hypothetical protein K461DRAFT_112072 [Myriangium duriaei CBS 260.36]|uniref:J domain-containing protein n=1 Tax=Myriangium duriaei CBS 260.36 TaxID=1168546 RepID=A0A9P4J4N7_9PEZI|nr:hypothetical protein K461DRAFT_112072 [Myriangium duriaei CBS 260.36]